jgi:hypothetical protein
MWGEDKLESKRKKLCRKCNPDDHGSHFSPNELPRLLEILNEGLSPEERAEKGGDLVVHHLCQRLGLVAHKDPESHAESAPVSNSIKTMVKLISGLAEASEIPRTSAVTWALLKDCYETLATVHNLQSQLERNTKEMA